MKDKIRYYDRNNVLRLTLNEYPYYSEPSDLKDWIWGFNEQFGVINTFYRNKAEYELVVGIAGDYLPHHDALCDIFSADVIANEPGYLELRGWRLPCYIVEASYEYGLSLDRQAKFRVRSVNSTWIRTNTRSYNGVPGGGLGGEDLGRDYIFSYVPPKKYEDTGEIIKIENDEENLTLTSLEVSLEPIQAGSGEPSPNNVRPISGRTEVVTHRTGKNLLDTSTASVGSFTFTQGDGGYISVSPNDTDPRTWGFASCQYKTALPKGTYKFVFDIKTKSTRSGRGYRVYDSNGNVLAQGYTTDVDASGASASFTLATTTEIGVMLKQYEAVARFMIVVATDSNDYEPFNGNTHTTALGRTVYGGTLDVVSGVLTVDRAMATFDGSSDEPWRLQSINSHGIANFTTDSLLPNVIKGKINAFVNNMLPLQASLIATTTIEGIYLNSVGTLFVRLNSERANTVDLFRTWLASNPLQVVYELATPQTYQLTPQQISLLLGENNLWTNTGGTIDVKYETISVPFPARGYNYGYSQPESHADVINLPGTGNGYEIIVYGPQTNPVIYLNNQPVQVNVELSAQQRLRIVSNGSVKTIEILSSSGQATDAFVYRDKENTPFLTLGQHTDLTFGQIRFDFTTIERRSEPTWT